jgi:hypothetical protein
MPSPSLIVLAVDLISALVAASLFQSTLKPCKDSGVAYLLGIPAAFGLLTIAFAAGALEYFGSVLVLDVIFLLVQMYALLFMALTYARRTRLRLVGESVSIELAIPSVVTVLVLGYVLVNANLSLQINGPVPLSMRLALRSVMILASVYLVYETGRNWFLTQRASQGFVTIGYGLLVIEQLGFLLQAWQFGDVAVLVGYEGRIVGLFVLLAITHLAIKQSDPTVILRRLGLTALAH